MLNVQGNYPPTVGGQYAEPFDRPEIDALGDRMEHLYRNCDLSSKDRGRLLVAYKRLREVDLFFTSGTFMNWPIPKSDVRPPRPSCADSPDYKGGYFRGVEELVSSLERRYLTEDVI